MRAPAQGLTIVYVLARVAVKAPGVDEVEVAAQAQRAPVAHRAVQALLGSRRAAAGRIALHVAHQARAPRVKALLLKAAHVGAHAKASVFVTLHPATLARRFARQHA